VLSLEIVLKENQRGHVGRGEGVVGVVLLICSVVVGVVLLICSDVVGVVLLICPLVVGVVLLICSGVVETSCSVVIISSIKVVSATAT